MFPARLVRCGGSPRGWRRGWLSCSSCLAAINRAHFNVGSGVGGVDTIQGKDLAGSKASYLLR